MEDPSRAKPELIEEISALKKRIQEMERSKTERKRLEDALQLSEERYRRIIETSLEGIFILDENFRFSFVNERYARMLGYSQEEMIGMDPVQIVFEEDIPEMLARREQRRQGISEPYERKLRRKDGSAMWVYVSINTMIDKSGQFQGSFAMHTDITQRKQAEEEREKLVKELQEAAAKIKTLNRMLPICAWCKKIRDDKGYWQQVEVYIRDHSEAEFTHGICPECKKKLHPDFDDEEK